MSLRLRLTLAVGLLIGAMAVLFALLVEPLLEARLAGADALAPQQHMLAEVRWLLLGCGVLVVLLGLGSAWLLTGRILRPMTRLMHEAAAVAASGRYDERVPTPGTRSHLSAPGCGAAGGDRR